MQNLTGLIRRPALLMLVAGSTSLAAGCAVSTQQEVDMGAQYASQINSQLPIVDDAALNRYINSLGTQLAQQGTRMRTEGLRYQFFIVNSNVVNAFSIPGGYVYVNRGIIERADNVSELAGVLAHEIAHVEERHSVKQMEKANNANLGLTLAYVLLGRQPSGAEQAAIQVGGGLVFARYSRQAEDDADGVAIPLMVRAGINPNGLPSFFNELLAERERSPSAVEMWFSTHPVTEERIAHTEQMIARIPASQMRGLITNSQAFNDAKARMRRYRAAPPQ